MLSLRRHPHVAALVALLLCLPAASSSSSVDAQAWGLYLPYKFTSTPYTSTWSTRPPGFTHQPDDITWQRVFSQSFLDLHWPVQNCTLPWRQQKLIACVQYAWSPPIWVNFSAYGETVPFVSISPAGYLYLNDNHFYQQPPDPSEPFLPNEPATRPYYMEQGRSVNRRLSDAHREYTAHLVVCCSVCCSLLRAPTFVEFGNQDQLWNVTIDSFHYATIVSNSAVNQTTIFLLNATLVSWYNESRPNRFTKLDFQLQLHQSTGAIVMHVLSFQNASAADLRNPMSIGIFSQNSGAVMARNVEFLDEPTMDPATYEWTPTVTPGDVKMQQQFCSSQSVCSICGHGGGCLWCASTSSCISNTSVAWCPEAPVSTCPLESLVDCTSCNHAGYTWCLGEADCTASTTQPTGQLCGTEPWFSSLSYGDRAGAPSLAFYPRCINSSETCGDQSCSQLFSTPTGPLVHMQCTSQPEPVESACVCAAGYISTTPNGSISSSFENGLCTLCDTQSDAYYIDLAGNCDACPTLTLGVGAALIVAAILVSIALIKLNSQPLVRKLLVPIQNAVVHFQVISLLAIIDFRWPLSLKQTFSAIDVAGFNLLHFPSFSCFIEPSTVLLLTLGAPLLIASILALIAFTAKFTVICRNEATYSSIEHQARMVETSRTLYARTFISFYLLYYNHLGYETLNGFQIGLGQQMLIASCCVYLVGLPLLFVFLLLRRRGQAARAAVTASGEVDLLEPLIFRFRPGLPQYTEALLTPIFKLLLNSIIIFASERWLQIVLMAVLLVGTVAIYGLWKPYVHAMDNREQTVLMTGSVVVLFSGILFYVASPGDTPAKEAVQVFSYVVVFGTLTTMCVVIAYTLFLMVQEHRRENAKEATAGGEAASSSTAPTSIEPTTSVYHSLADGPSLLAAASAAKKPARPAASTATSKPSSRPTSAASSKIAEDMPLLSSNDYAFLSSNQPAIRSSEDDLPPMNSSAQSSISRAEAAQRQTQPRSPAPPAPAAVQPRASSIQDASAPSPLVSSLDAKAAKPASFSIAKADLEDD